MLSARALHAVSRTGVRARSAGLGAGSPQRPPAPARAIAAPLRPVEVPKLDADVPSDIESVLFSRAEVAARTRELARDIVAEYRGKDLIVVGVLKGAFMFMADLTRHIAEDMPNVAIDFIKASSYGSNSVSVGSVAVDMCGDAASRWAGRHVLLVEDIVDSGKTLARLSAEAAACGAASVRVVALLDKKGRRQVDFAADYVGFDVPDVFIVGNGLDYNEMYRCLPYVAVLSPHVYNGAAHQ